MALTQISDAGLKKPSSDLQDNEKIVLGTGNDLEIYHDGSDSYIKDAGTGQLHIHTNEFRIQNAAGNEQQISANEDGAVELFYDGSKKFETSNTGVSFGDNWLYGNDNAQIRLGNGADLQLSHDGSNSYIKDAGTGNLYIYSENLRIENADGSDSYIEANNGGAAELYWDGSKKFETRSDGTWTSGDIYAQTTGNASLLIGSTDAGGASLYLDGDSNGDWSGSDYAYIRHSTDGNLEIVSANPSGGGHIYMKVNNTELALRAYANAGVELYYNDSKRLETTANGVTLEHNLLLDNATNAGRDITWDPSNDQLQFKDNTKASFGSSSDLQIAHDGSDSNIKNTGTGHLYLYANSSDKGIVIKSDSDVELYYDNSLKLETASTGVGINGKLFFDGDGGAYIENTASNELTVKTDSTVCTIFAANQRVKMPTVYSTNGSSMNDVQIESDGTLCAGNTSIRASKKNIVSQTDVSWLYNLNPVTFNYRKKLVHPTTGEHTYLEEVESETAYGLIAEEVETVNKDFCFYNDDKLAGVYYKQLITPLLKALQDQKKEIDTLKTKVAALEAK